MLANRVQEKTKSLRAFNRLFGTQQPHTIIERLLRMSSRALHENVNREIFRLLAFEPGLFYVESDFPVNHNLKHGSIWSDGTLLDRWEKYVNKPNPHHIVPRSRG